MVSVSAGKLCFFFGFPSPSLSLSLFSFFLFFLFSFFFFRSKESKLLVHVYSRLEAAIYEQCQSHCQRHQPRPQLGSSASRIGRGTSTARYFVALLSRHSSFRSKNTFQFVTLILHSCASFPAPPPPPPHPHTPSIAFRHLPPNSARFGYATEGALYLRAAVHRRGQRPPKGSGTDKTVEAT